MCFLVLYFKTVVNYPLHTSIFLLITYNSFNLPVFISLYLLFIQFSRCTCFKTLNLLFSALYHLKLLFLSDINH